ncbi:O-antigen/teichoic acid export membrane protein [Micromonospora pisi]|uniref:O-antigen/teichoic acid export membrane protein n=1 Tax=Micromonospora pisi TaxID=589240 RepID=A0A495JQT4_9ACTN|nr:oligosaccharide flippase family protein [Micromonospora pisi]RKR91326.1 O-antigen/teichoic acid export membrane protein [Micromonospora pisi]
MENAGTGTQVAAARRRSPVAFLTGSSLAQSASYGLSALLASALLGPHQRGLMLLGITTGSIAGLLAGLGTGSALRSRLPAVSGTATGARLLASYTWWSMLSVVTGGGLAILLSRLAAPLVDTGLGEPPFLAAVLVVTTGYVALTQLPDVWCATGRSRAGSVWAALVAAGGLVGVLIGATLDRSAWALLLAQGTGMVAIAALQAARLRVVGLVPLASPAGRELAELLRHGCRALGLTMGLALALRADRYVLGAVAGAATVGIYSVAATLSEGPRVVPAALGWIVNRDVALGAGVSRVVRTRRTALLAAAAVSLLVGVGGWFLIIPIFGTEFADARPLLLVLLLAEITFAPFAVASQGLLGGGWTTTAGLLGAAGGVMALVLFATAIPLWGGYGTAIAYVLTYAGLSVVSWRLLRPRLVGNIAPRRHGTTSPPIRV